MPNDKISDEDKALFRSMMLAVKPLALKQVRKSRVTTAAVQTTPTTSPSFIQNKPQLTSRKKNDEQTPPPEKNTQEMRYSISDHYTDVVYPETILSYCKQTIPRHRLMQLRKGEIPWEARLDLHGLRPDAARESLCRFLSHQSQHSSRCLLIIHGKGSPHGAPPVLKNLVYHWLQQLPQVLAFHSTLARDGGSGALYVLLQRQR